MIVVIRDDGVQCGKWFQETLTVLSLVLTASKLVLAFNSAKYGPKIA
jgi:hypothetical protein